MNPGPKGTFPYDFAIYDRDGQLLTLVEVKRRWETDSTWAREWHAILVERVGRAIPVNVVLIVPDRIYAWRPDADGLADPALVLDATPWLAPYFARLEIDPAEVIPYVFEQIVGLWLADLVEGTLGKGRDAGPSTELLEILCGGEVVQQVAA